MKPPARTDRVVKVTAYLTDEAFGYEHWRAAQFGAVARDRRPALLLICRSEEERERLGKAMIDLVAAEDR